MLQITLSQRVRDEPLDQLTEDELYETARSAWVLGARADRERYAIVCTKDSAGGEYRVVLAIEIDRLELVVERPADDPRDHRRALHGRILKPGHPVYDTYVGREPPALPTRNPVKYAPSRFDTTPCRCGCGQNAIRDFLPGHDQRAIRDRVSQFPSVTAFLDWFDARYPTGDHGGEV